MSTNSHEALIQKINASRLEFLEYQMSVVRKTLDLDEDKMRVDFNQARAVKQVEANGETVREVRKGAVLAVVAFAVAAAAIWLILQIS